MNQTKTKIRVSLYVLLAFLLPLISVVSIKICGQYLQDKWSYLALGFAAMTPSLAAILTIFITGGRNEICLFLKKCYIENAIIKYMLVAILLPMIVLLMSKLTYYVFIDNTHFATGIGLKKFIIIIWALIAEEIGWRGFLQEQMDFRLGHILTPIVIGLIWSLWHYHYYLFDTMSVPFYLFTLGCIADSFGYYWLTKKSNGNIIPASLWHFTGNLFAAILLISPVYNHGSSLLYFVYVLYSVLMAILITIWGMSTSRVKISL